jgi:hypothetical protein
MFEPIENHLYAIHTRRYDTTLLRAVSRGDRLERGALQWVRLLDPATLTGGNELPECTCHTGRCEICN